MKSLALGWGLQAVALLLEISIHTHALKPCHQTIDVYLLTGNNCDSHQLLRDMNLGFFTPLSVMKIQKSTVSSLLSKLCFAAEKAAQCHRYPNNVQYITQHLSKHPQNMSWSLLKLSHGSRDQLTRVHASC